MPNIKQAFNTINLNVVYDNIVKYANDDRFYVATNPVPSDFNTFLGKPMTKIRVLEVQTFVYRPLFNVILGDAPIRKVINFYSSGIIFKLGGVLIRDNTFDIVLQATTVYEDSIVNFGHGVIVDEIIFPTQISNIIIDSTPPTNNDLLSVDVLYTIKYNQNF